MRVRGFSVAVRYGRTADSPPVVSRCPARDSCPLRTDAALARPRSHTRNEWTVLLAGCRPVHLQLPGPRYDFPRPV